MGEEEKKSESESCGIMKPWEQHSSVILMPRYDYKAPSLFLQRSHSGFLITCTIKREKSATKEAISILQNYLNGEAEAEASLLSLVKLTRSGLLLLTFTKQTNLHVVDIVSHIIQSNQSPQWCHRIFPIQSTCNLNETELRPLVSKLVGQFLNDINNNINNTIKLTQPITFAIAYNRRGIESTEMKSKHISDHFPLLDRHKCFAVVATAVKDVVPNAIVDLKSPQMSILVELLPLSGLQKTSLVVAVSVLPLNLVTTKPRLCIKPLVAEANAMKESKELT
ncbi:hypothetical protein ACFE04_020251 [Oxalis oulophora]